MEGEQEFFACLSESSLSTDSSGDVINKSGETNGQLPTISSRRHCVCAFTAPQHPYLPGMVPMHISSNTQVNNSSQRNSSL